MDVRNVMLVVFPSFEDFTVKFPGILNYAPYHGQQFEQNKKYDRQSNGIKSFMLLLDIANTFCSHLNM